MNRRKFLWTGAIFVPAAKSIAQASLRSPAFVGGLNKPTASATCQLVSSQSQETDNDYWGLTTVWSQLIKVSASMEVCQVDLKIYVTSGSENVYVQFRSASNAGGSQIGTDSQTVAVSNTSAAWKTFQWSANPTVSADCYLTIRTAGSAVRIRSDTHASAGSTHYPYTDATDDSTYCAYDATTQRGIIDLCFRIYAMQ